jgi:hypothetical protein
MRDHVATHGRLFSTGFDKVLKGLTRKPWLVEVESDFLFGGTPLRQFWIAAVPFDDAIETVLSKCPHGWGARVISSEILTPDQITALNLRLGDVMELGF